MTKGKLFHSLAAFKEDFTQPILQGQNPTASYEQQQASSFAAEKLLETTRHIILQRKKCELTESTMMKLPEKVELVVWIPLSSAQSSMYEDFIHSRQFSTALHRSTCPVEVINHLKTVCRHPFLIEAALANKRRKSALASSSSSSSSTSKYPSDNTGHQPVKKNEMQHIGRIVVCDSESDDDESNTLALPRELEARLMRHQLEGVQWLHGTFIHHH